MKTRALKAILAGGLIGGAFDITFACVVSAFRGVSPIRVGQSVASDPADTELDEYWKGTSRWDEQWERDQERRDGYD